MAKLVVRHEGQIVQELVLTEGQEYIGGRDDSCQIVLGGRSGISRQHFKIYHNGTNWQVDVISKFGHLNFQAREVHVINLEDTCVFSLPPYEFQFLAERGGSIAVTEKSIVADSIESEQNEPSIESPESALPAVIENEDKTMAVHKAPNQDSSEFEGDEGDTSPGINLSEPVVTIYGPSRENLGSFALKEGNLWVAGREDSCDIKIPDKKASRRHFEISRTETGFLLTDLGSSNGTGINDRKVPPKGSAPLSSGDNIRVGSIKIRFEIRNQQLQQQIQNLPDILFNQNVAGPSHMPAMYDGSAELAEYGDGAQSNKPKINIKVIAIGIIGFAIVYSFMGGQSTNQPTDQKVVVSDNPTNNLDARQKQFIKETYSLAKNLHAQGKYQLANDNLKKIHEIVPYFEKSKELEQDCKQALEVIEEQLEQERQQKIAKENQERIQTIVTQCKSKFNANSTSQSVNDCLAPAIEIDPSNSKIQELVALATAQDEQRSMTAANEADRREKLNRSVAFFRECEKLQNEQQLYLARKKCQEYITSSLPDTNGSKQKAQRYIANINQTLEQKVGELLRTAQDLSSKEDFRGALKKIQEAQKMNPTEPSIKETESGIVTVMNKKLKALYQDAKLEESLGNVTVTKEKCAKIMELSFPENEYYTRCKNIVKKYGD